MSGVQQRMSSACPENIPPRHDSWQRRAGCIALSCPLDSSVSPGDRLPVTVLLTAIEGDVRCGCEPWAHFNVKLIMINPTACYWSVKFICFVMPLPKRRGFTICHFSLTVFQSCTVLFCQQSPSVVLTVSMLITRCNFFSWHLESQYTGWPKPGLWGLFALSSFSVF